MITIKTESDFDLMRRAGHIVRECLETVGKKVKPGLTTDDLDAIVESIILRRGAKPAFKGYLGFPKTVCASVNEEVVHGIPGKRKLEEGDIVGIDIGAIVEGYYADAARTFPVGKIDVEKKKLIEVTRNALKKGIAKVAAGNRISDISHAVECAIEPLGFGIVRQYVGHGIGRELHEDPQIPNFGKPHQGPTIEVGMAFAIEPMVNAGTHEVVVAEDQWTVVTKDHRPSAHFENTVLVTEKGLEVVTDHA